MLVAFIGVPFSGKSTVACSMFTNLKSSLVQTELITEKAREYIAKYKLENKLNNNSKILLTDKDQLNIASDQFKTEKAFKYSCSPNTVIISDSCVYNTTLYLNEDYFNSPEIQDFFFNKVLDHYDLLFYCLPVELDFIPNDSNRIHNKDQILNLQNKAQKLVDKLKSKGLQIETLLNDQESRVRNSTSITLNKHCKLLETIHPKEF